MNPQVATPAMALKRFFQLLLVILAFTFVVRVMLVPSTAQSTPEERELEDKLPKHLPIKVKLKKEKEKAFKDMKNEKWVRALELEVTNTGDKPIYSLSFVLEMPEIKYSDGLTAALTLVYGKMTGTINTKPGPNDIPIKPGETYVLKVVLGEVLGWEDTQREENLPQPKKLILLLQHLWFGDGTGFEGTDGFPMPNKQNKQSSTGGCLPPSKSKAKSPREQRTALGSWGETFKMNFLPASFSPVNFYLLSRHRLISSVYFHSHKSVALVAGAGSRRNILNLIVMVVRLKIDSSLLFAATQRVGAQFSVTVQSFVRFLKLGRSIAVW